MTPVALARFTESEQTTETVEAYEAIWHGRARKLVDNKKRKVYCPRMLPSKATKGNEFDRVFRCLTPELAFASYDEIILAERLEDYTPPGYRPMPSEAPRREEEDAEVPPLPFPQVGQVIARQFQEDPELDGQLQDAQVPVQPAEAPRSEVASAAEDLKMAVRSLTDLADGISDSEAENYTSRVENAAGVGSSSSSCAAVPHSPLPSAGSVISTAQVFHMSSESDDEQEAAAVSGRWAAGSLQPVITPTAFPEEEVAPPGAFSYSAEEQTWTRLGASPASPPRMDEMQHTDIRNHRDATGLI